MKKNPVVNGLQPTTGYSIQTNIESTEPAKDSRA